MPLPEGFNDWEHVQSVYMQIHNREVREEFNDIELDDDVTTARGSLKVACLIKDNDTSQLMDLRERLFERIKGRNVIATGGGSSDFVPRRRKPKILLYFSEDLSDVETGYDPIAGEISFRLMNEPETGIMSQSEAVGYANKIKTTFGTNNGFVWRKGREMYNYTDWYKGYQLQVLAIAESDAKAVITAALSVQSYAPDWDNLSKSVAVNASTVYPANPGMVTTVGKTVKLPRRRPVANVRFQYAQLFLHTLSRPVLLYDRTGLLDNALVN